MHIGETVGKLSDDLLEKSPEIHWEKIRGLRHRIAHDYIALDIVIIFDVVKNKLPDFLNAVYALTVKRLHEGILSVEELNLAVGSRYCQWPTELSHYWPLILSHFSREKSLVQF
jgi:hypothetical protein